MEQRSAVFDDDRDCKDGVLDYRVKLLGREGANLLEVGYLQIVSEEPKQLRPSIEPSSDHDHGHDRTNCLADVLMLVVERFLESELDVIY